MDKNAEWNQQLNRSEQYARMIERIFQNAIKEACFAIYKQKYDPKKPFKFEDFPGVTDRVNRLFSKLMKDMRLVIITGTQREWENANAYNDIVVDQVLKTLNLPEEIVSKYKNRNLDALKTFQDRKIKGMNLSGRVWDLKEQLKQELELAIDLGLGEAKSAADLSMDVRQYLNEPNKLFRRVRNKRGQLQLSKAAKAYNPGQGVYRSSYKNAMRLTRTEINAAYKTADFERWQQMDFVVGFEVRRSNNLTDCPICDAFVGRYPKTYKFINVHPHCRCICIAIMATQKEMDDHFDKVLAGEESELKSAYEVKQMPKGWKDYIIDNKDRILRAKQPPYWVADNFKGGKLTGGLNIGI
jgi:hypothetical protein